MTTKLPCLHTHLSLPTHRASASPGLRLFEQQNHSPPSAPEIKRRRIWELSSNFHCSIVGTCLTTTELRHILVKMQVPGVHKESDHELHGRAVLLAGQKDHTAKLLQKALDRRHRTAISQFGKARTTEQLRVEWTSAVQRAEIPGAYWAVLTHPQATEDLVRQVFGEVHMLSHLVGAANRADIRRLRELESENAALQDKVTRQQRQLRDAVVSRDATIANLNGVLGRAIATARQERRTSTDPLAEPERQATARLIDDLQRRLNLEGNARERSQRRAQRLAAELEVERKQRSELERRERELQAELDGVERSLIRQAPGSAVESEQPIDLSGVTLLYVGGRAHNVIQLRMLAERSGATFLHHDGGIDDRNGLLASHVARADVVYFPVDCVSHNAVAVVKRVARHLGKPYVALRSAGLTSFVAALRRDRGGMVEPQQHGIQSFG